MSLTHLRDIFVPVFPAELNASAAENYAASLAAACGAATTLRAFAMEAWVPYSPFSSVAAGHVGAANVATRATVDAFVARARKARGIGAPLLDVESFVGSHAGILQAVSFHARLQGLSVVDRSTRLLGEGAAALNELIFGSGRPVIVTPPGASTFQAKRIVTAWDGSAQASRALNDALPFLRAAEHVEVVCVTNEKDLAGAAPGSEVARHLGRYGVRVEVVDLTPADRSAARAIRDHAELVAADMIVMGAFAHSRMRQLVMGGVTDSMLTNCELPLFLSH